LPSNQRIPRVRWPKSLENNGAKLHRGALAISRIFGRLDAGTELAAPGREPAPQVASRLDDDEKNAYIL
jgi:hypothetical protein